MMFRVGDKLRCIDDSIKKGRESFVKETYYQWLKKGNEYTIRQILDNDGIVTGLLLEEIFNFEVYQPLLGISQEPAFATTRFVKTQSATKESYFEEKNTILEEIKLN